VPDDDDHWAESGSVRALTHAQYGIPGVELIVPVAEIDAVEAKLVAAGLLPIEDASVIDAWRIELGRPAAGAELTGDFTPLEVEMEWACSDNKGCYTGQEIIARQRTYDKVTRSLVGLRAQQPLSPGDALIGEGREVGKITSAAVSPTTGMPIALAVVKRPHNQAGTRLMAGNVEVEVVEI
jgi:folate-binding protein YgfZ